MRIFRIIMAIVPAVLLLLGASPAYAACPAADGSPKSQVLIGSSQTSGDCTETGVTNIVTTITQILSVIVGIVAIIVILLAGLKYITAAGDSGKITGAKNALVYAIIGLVIAALAQVIVHTVFKSATDSSKLPPKAAFLLSPARKIDRRPMS